MKRKLSEEHKRKIGEASKKRWAEKGFKDKMCKMRIGHEVSQETRDKIKSAHSGRKNPWTVLYNKTRPKVSGWHHTKESKNKISEGTSGKKNGMYGKSPPIVKCFEHIDKKGRIFKLRSSWEAKVANYFDENDIDWDYEKTTFKLSDGGTYTPDFFTNDYIYEVKGYFHKRSKEKFECFKKDYPHLKIILANKKYLTERFNIKL
jgi:hypothetical protein